MRRSFLAWGTSLAVLGLGCGGDDQGPTQSPLVMEKPATKSGDQQTGPVALPLGNPLRVQITRDGEPVEGENISWEAGGGGSFSAITESGEDGIASAVWTLGPTLGNQSATASIDDADGSPLTYTAVGTEGTPPPTGPTVNVVNNQFEPAVLTITVGQTVTWIWDDEAVGHNVVPDDRNNPTTSGPVEDGPATYAFTFNTVGAFRYYCQAHGGLAGVGMSGRVIVQENN
jgi:plastocyanin